MADHPQEGDADGEADDEFAEGHLAHHGQPGEPFKAADDDKGQHRADDQAIEKDRPDGSHQKVLTAVGAVGCQEGGQRSEEGIPQGGKEQIGQQASNGNTGDRPRGTKGEEGQDLGDAELNGAESDLPEGQGQHHVKRRDQTGQDQPLNGELFFHYSFSP